MSSELNDLPCVEADSPFSFACGPDQPCFNRCCAELNLPLTPYDLLRLTHNLGISPGEFLRAFTTMIRDADTGFPAFQLRMIESPDEPCPFVTPAGCAVYADRPGACRAYPLGRGTKLDKDGVLERYFMIREDHCCGFGSGPTITPAQWFASQGLDLYIYFNDRYMRLLSMIRAGGKPVSPRLAGMIDISLWQLDKFAELIAKMDLLSQLEGPAVEKNNLLENDLPGLESRLELGLCWLELIIFGQAEKLQRKI